MRRLRVLLYWLFYSKNNVSIKELFLFLCKPKVHNIAKKHIASIDESENYYKVSFHPIKESLFWPKRFPIDFVYQVTAETFDEKDFHFYQYKTTTIAQDEILLDIGTAEGLFPLSVIHKCKHIYMVEPSKVFLEPLHKTFAPFNDKITIFNTAVGSEKGIVSFNENSLDGQITREFDENNTVEINTIDAIIDNKKITYLKADIEGFEYEMLKGAAEVIKRNKPKIAITTYHKQNDYKEIISLVKSYVPEYNFFVKGIHGEEPKPVMLHFWI